MWPVFTGGKRIYANKIGKTMVSIAEVNRSQVDANQQSLLIEAYFGLRLGKEKAITDQEVGIDKFYSQLQNALDNVKALDTTIEMSRELIRMRKKSFRRLPLRWPMYSSTRWERRLSKSVWST